MSIDLALVFPRLTPSGDPPLGIASIAAYVRSQGYKIAIVDGTWAKDWKAVADEVVRLDPAVVGMYTATILMPTASRITGRIRMLDHLAGRRRLIWAGGPHVTVQPQDGKFLDADRVLAGEGEYQVADLLGGREPANRQPDLATLPAPALDMLDMKRYVEHWHLLAPYKPGWKGTNLLSARGCPMACSFCQPQLDLLFGRKLRTRTPQQVVDEMEVLHERYAISGFFFHDDSFTVARRWMDELFGLMGKMTFFPIWGANARVDQVDDEMLRALAVHGCRTLHFGAESASQRILDLYDKRITVEQIKDAVHMARQRGIAPGAFWILGAPTETEQEMRQSIDLALSLPLAEASFSICNALPGTYLYEHLQRDGVEVSHNFADFNYYSRRCFEGTVPTKRVKELQREALTRFYLRRPSYLLGHLTSVRGMRVLWQKVRRFV